MGNVSLKVLEKSLNFLFKKRVQTPIDRPQVKVVTGPLAEFFLIVLSSNPQLCL